MSGQGFIAPEPDGVCELCKKTAELRPVRPKWRARMFRMRAERSKGDGARHGLVYLQESTSTQPMNKRTPADPTMEDDENPPAGHLEIGLSAGGEYVIVKHPYIEIDANGYGTIVFTATQVREFARLLLECADESELAQLPRC